MQALRPYQINFNQHCFLIIVKKAIAILQCRKDFQVYSNKTPKMKVKEVLKRLQADGWYEERMRGINYEKVRSDL